jgi:hypothetical protein
MPNVWRAIARVGFAHAPNNDPLHGADGALILVVGQPGRRPPR